MAEYAKSRSCKRFVVPGAKVRHKRTGLFGFFKNFSKAQPLLNLSKGGLAFQSEEKFSRDEKIIAQLIVPKENPLNMRSRVRWQGQQDSKGPQAIGITFMPFGSSMGWNSHESLNVLRSLDAQYTNKEKEKEKVDIDLRNIW